MYTAFYKLRENPFNITADPSFFFFSDNHKKAIASLKYGITEKKGIIQLTGAVGTGKTTLCRMLLNTLKDDAKFSFVFNPYLSDLQLLQSIVIDFGIKVKKISKFDLIWELNNFLLKQKAESKNAVLIIDEAQNLRKQQLEQVRLLSNLETEKEKLLQILLVGQPELKEKLTDPSLYQINQRIAVSYYVEPLKQQEVKDYINHRLHTAGSNGGIHFSEKAVEMIFEFSMGTPRLINILCDRILLAGFAKETRNFTEELIFECIKELNEHNIRCPQ